MPTQQTQACTRHTHTGYPGEPPCEPADTGECIHTQYPWRQNRDIFWSCLTDLPNTVNPKAIFLPCQTALYLRQTDAKSKKRLSGADPGFWSGGPAEF